MPSKLGPEDFDLLIKFGGGLHTRAAEDDIGEREAADGNNFLLDLENRELRARGPFDLVATAPNSAAIRGGGSFLLSDGTAAAFFQAGDTVYAFDGADFQASPVLDTVSTSARLRAHWRSHAWTLGDKCIITDLALVEVVKEWDGSSVIVDPTFLSGASANFGTFHAKYCDVSNERAVFAHVKDASATTRHMIVGSERGSFERISVSDRPSSDLGADDPFFLLAPDLRPINGLVQAFGTTVFSTEQGQLFNLTGVDAQDFAIEDFYAGSAAAGQEALAYIGNDVIYGRKGRIESLRDTDRFGDSEADDITRQIADTVKEYVGWTIVYNSRLNRVYCFPTSQSEVWVFDTVMLGGDVSPWMRWVTSHSLAFQPTFVQSMLDPADGLEYVFMGDSSGNIYRLEGTGTGGDGGTNNISTEFVTKLFSAPLTAEAFDFEGWIKYRKDVEATIELIFEYAGENIFNETIEVTFPAITERSFYANGLYYNDGNYYGTISGRLARQKIAPQGAGTDFQVRVKSDGKAAFSINEIGLRFRAAGK